MSKGSLFKLSAVMVVLLASITAVPVLAAPPTPVIIDVPETTGTPSSSPFTSNIPGCEAGTVIEDGAVEVAGHPAGDIVILRVDKVFTCAGGDTFVLRLVVRLNTATHYTTARWRAISGTGDFAGLRGNGLLEGTPDDPGVSIDDHYEGRFF